MRAVTLYGQPGQALKNRRPTARHQRSGANQDVFNDIVEPKRSPVDTTTSDPLTLCVEHGATILMTDVHDAILLRAYLNNRTNDFITAAASSRKSAHICSNHL